MRRPGPLLLICLLTLRVWVGDAMAFASLPALQGSAWMATTGQALPPCHEATALVSAAQPQTLQAPQDAGPADHGGPCNACQVCHLPLLAWALPAYLGGPLPQAVHTAPVARFQSAHLAPHLPPPSAESPSALPRRAPQEPAEPCAPAQAMGRAASVLTIVE